MGQWGKARRKGTPPPANVPPDEWYWAIVDTGAARKCDHCGAYGVDIFGVSSGFKVVPMGEQWCGSCVREGLKGGLD